MEAVPIKKNRNTTSIVFACFLAVAWVVFFLLILHVKDSTPMKLDTFIQDWLVSWGGSSSEAFFSSVTRLGSREVIGTLSLLFIAFLWFSRKNYLAMAVVVLGVAGGDQLYKLVKNLVERDRPSLNAAVDGVGYSFPSGHAAVGFILYFLAGYFLFSYCRTRTAKAILCFAVFIIILLIGMSRVYFNVHYPTDVIGGYALGFIYTAGLLHFYEIFFAYMKRKKQI
ncbi:phosphatase PAP2 family protein [Peribacillus kribbensis]|uniref:phosphatase PAP2 family protein n=1 Tax=Peribacillus kribbensis TaxID=356658 RepID=UPI00041B0AA1|nr:phosphatase PAP2 family protein [Peribacillus kribbensis]